MKCPHCNSDMTTHGFDVLGLRIFPWGRVGIDDRGLFVQKPVKWQAVCPNCKVSGPRQSSKQDAEDALRRLCGQSQEA